MRLPPRPVRRVLSPAIVATEVVLLAGFAVVALLGALVAPIARQRRLLRVGAFGAGYLAVEVAVAVATFWLWVAKPFAGRRRPDGRWWLDVHEDLLRWALGRILGCAGACFAFRVVPELPPGPLDADRPALVLARHGGPGDSFALVHMLLARDRGVRIVLKEILQLDPALDIILNRLGSCFLPSAPGPDDDLPARLGRLAAGLAGRETLLVFPEGGNWTPARRWRAIRRLRADDKPDAARAALLMTHVLPPRPAGVLAVLEARPDLPVVIVAHAGIDRIVTLRQAWDALPLTTPMTVRAWPAAPVPPAADGADARLQWLTTEWATVDEWVDAHRPPASPERSQAPGRLGP